MDDPTLISTRASSWVPVFGPICNVITIVFALCALVLLCLPSTYPIPGVSIDPLPLRFFLEHSSLDTGPLLAVKYEIHECDPRLEHRIGSHLSKGFTRLPALSWPYTGRRPGKRASMDKTFEKRPVDHLGTLPRR